MAECLDTFDKAGNKTGTIKKGENTQDYVKCCSCFVINGKNQVLIEKRGNTVLDAGKLDLCSGHIKSGEISVQGMVRELGEELGIAPEEAMNIKKIGNVLLDFTKTKSNFKCITDIFILKRDKEDLKLQDEEVKGIEYYDLDEVISLIRDGKTRIPFGKENEKDFEKIFEKIKEELGIKAKKSNNNVMEK